ncbi:hypothetical protein GQ44DRAFT_762016 [Phaeosphaeriaceae sp. PMI808]|nr:hypothetical protein GQ44DRAFT_762016 [Phaeosphaeriaceae sp. PMI808]
MTPVLGDPSFTNGDKTCAQEYDVVIVGAGFAGISTLYRARKDGLRAHIFEAGSDFGGVWYWNRYPGARVDSETPFYQLTIPEVYNTWLFSQRYPDHAELRRYMAHVDTMLNLRPDVTFNAKVNGCSWDSDSAKWTVRTESGTTARARFLILATGLLCKTNLPEWPGRSTYKGVIHHSGAWPEDTDVTGKRVAIIGAGATSVQIVQELGKVASQLTVLHRRPSYCIPMGQRAWTEEEQVAWRSYYPALFAAGRNSAAGFPVTRLDLRAQDVSATEREQHYESMWNTGGFNFLTRGYTNTLIDPEANKLAYEFWKKKVRKRLSDPVKQELMAPEEMPFFFGTKRSPLETDYYDILNQGNVEIVDINKHPIQSFTEHGLQLGGEDRDREFDYVVCATGFDAFTGSLTNMGLKNKDGVDLKELWRDGVRTYMGVLMNSFPNAFMVYSPQAPNALANGPTIIECQRDLILDIIKNMRGQGLTTIEPTREAEDEWKAGMNAMIQHTLYPFTNSWWNTSNIEGKKAETQSYIGGIKNYEADCREKIKGWQGLVVGGRA